MNRIVAKNHIKATCGEGWLNLVDIIYDNKPDNIEITEVFQKWAGLKITLRGEDECYEELLDMVYYLSQKMCEVCGKSAGITVIDGWETTLCKQHFEESEGKQKYRNDSNDKDEVMKGKLWIGNIEVGDIEFRITDKSMGVIAGILTPNENYEQFKPQIQQHFELNGISNSSHFPYRIILDSHFELQPQGGIAVIDAEGFDEGIWVESAGNDFDSWKWV